MNDSIISYFFLLLLLLSACHPQGEESNASPFYLGGVQINEPDHQEWMSTLKNTGMNTVSVTVYARQGVWNRDHLWWAEEDPAVISEIEAAKDAGVKVVFIPRVTLDHYFAENKFLWHGMTMPQTDSMVVNWFKWYTVFLEKWAKTCEQYEVDVMAIGSELRTLSGCRPVQSLPQLEDYYLDEKKQAHYLNNHLAFSEQIKIKELWVRGADNYESLETYLQDEIATHIDWARQVGFQERDHSIQAINQRRALLRSEWYKLIQRIRNVYSGQLTYAANFDNYQNVVFWDSLDMMGINAYFKLRTLQDRDSLYRSIKYSWDTIFSGIGNFQERQQIEQPVLFTELGYINRENCTVMPWEGSGFSVTEEAGEKTLMIWSEQKKDPDERTLAIRALWEAEQQSAVELRGILYWKLTSKFYHLPYEPFALHLSDQFPDSLQIALTKFLK